jgi:hypothetical protein
MNVDREMRVTDHIFSYERADTKEVLYFNTCLLERIRVQHPEWFRRITLDVTPEIYDLVLHGRGIEEDHLARLSAERLEQPGLGIFFDEGSFVLVDGNHRLTQLYRLGKRTMDVWCTPRPVWDLCLVNLCPELKASLDSERPKLPDVKTTIVSGATVHGS